MEYRRNQMSIDTSFKPFYNRDFKGMGTKYMELLQFPELIELTKSHSISDFYDIIRKYRLHEKIKICNGKLSTNINFTAIQELFPDFLFSLPKDEFLIYRQFQNKREPNYSRKSKENIISLALTKKNYINYTCKSQF